MQNLLKIEITVLVIYIVLFMLLLYCSIEDIRTKKIDIRKLIVVFIILLPSMFLRSDIHILECLSGIVLGVIFIAISKITRGQIGMGDGYIICVTGLGFGIWRSLEMLCYALFFAAIYSMFLLVRHYANRKKLIPFVPFLFLGFILCIVFRGYQV